MSDHARPQDGSRQTPGPRAGSTTVLRSVPRVLLLAAGAVLIAVAILAGIGSRGTALLVRGSSGDRGLHLWRSYQCGTCHAVFGLGGHIGPDLTNVMRRRSETFVRHMLRHGAGAMPALNLGDVAAGEMIAYLHHLDRLATYPLDSPAAPAFGIHP